MKGKRGDVMTMSLRRVAVWMMLCFVCVFFLGGNLRKVNGVAEKDSVQLPILMYHHILKDSNRWNMFVISPAEFEQDLIFLKEQGFETIVIEDLLLYEKGEKKLPEKPVMITIDDGYLSVKEYMMPLLQKYQMKAVFSVIGRYSEEYSQTKDHNVSYAHVSWEDLQELTADGTFEIQNHSYDLHKNANGRKGAKQRYGEPLEDYRKLLTEDLGKTQAKIEESIHKKPHCFTYPFGFFSKESEEIVKEMGFLASLSCSEGINYLSGKADELYLLKRYNRPHGKSAESIIRKSGLLQNN